VVVDPLGEGLPGPAVVDRRRRRRPAHVQTARKADARSARSRSGFPVFAVALLCRRLHVKSNLPRGEKLINDLRVGDVAALMRDARKSATYKPALLKALVRRSREPHVARLSLLDLGEEFAKLYWNQTVIYHLRQAASLSKEAAVVRSIRETAARYKTRSLSNLPKSGQTDIAARLAAILPVNVLGAFHAGKPADMPDLYRWERGWPYVEITRDAHQFLRANALPLELIANYFWADLLEHCNRLAPRIIQKVSRDAASRKSLQKYLNILLAESAATCFYCDVAFDTLHAPTVDHVIPWSFLLEDPLWDLVLACGRCNSQKSDWLPSEDLLQKLLRRSRSGLRRPTSSVSFLITDGDVEQLYQAAISVEWPRFWSPA